MKKYPDKPKTDPVTAPIKNYFIKLISSSHHSESLSFLIPSLAIDKGSHIPIKNTHIVICEIAVTIMFYGIFFYVPYPWYFNLIIVGNSNPGPTLAQINPKVSANLQGKSVRTVASKQTSKPSMNTGMIPRKITSLALASKDKFIPESNKTVHKVSALNLAAASSL